MNNRANEVRSRIEVLCDKYNLDYVYNYLDRVFILFDNTKYSILYPPKRIGSITLEDLESLPQNELEERVVGFILHSLADTPPPC